MNINATGGKKDDLEKIRFDLLIPEYLKGVAEVMTHGANKYGAYNYLHLEEWQIKAAHERHFNAYCSGELLDPETKKSHLFHVGCNTMMLWAVDNSFYGKQQKLDTKKYDQIEAALKFIQHLIQKNEFCSAMTLDDNTIGVTGNNFTVYFKKEGDENTAEPIIANIDKRRIDLKTVEQVIRVFNEQPKD